MTKFLTQQQIDAYNQDGFVSPIDLMSEDEALGLRQELEDAEARWPEAFDGASRNNAHLNFTFLDRIVHDNRLLDAVEDLIGSNISVYGTVLFIKEPGTVGHVSWHQDGTYMGLAPLTGVTAWIALSHSNEESGCMRMMPGTHRDAIQPHSDTFGETNILTRGQTIENVDESQAVDLELRPGQMSFHHMRTIHSSQPNRSNDRRIGFVIQCFMPPEMRQTISPTHAQPARGEGPHPDFLIAGRPVENMASADVALRNQVNAEWSDILYHGADRRRDY